jgi:uncharacterized membrane protein YkvA (DUF1232 family)
MNRLETWKRRARLLKVEVYALYLACRDPRVPWYAKAFTACVVGYAFSPIDLIPDFIPVLGYLDDLVLVPLGVIVARQMIPTEILAECRGRAQVVIETRCAGQSDGGRGHHCDLVGGGSRGGPTGDPAGREAHLDRRLWLLPSCPCR